MAVSGASSIEWTDATWNPVRGCSRVSEGCRNCYAERQAARNLPGMRSPTTGEPFATRTAAGPRWTGEVELIPSALDWPLRKRKPLRIFVNSMSDLFHEKLSNEAIAAVFGVMAACPQHTFQILTKRPERMREWFDKMEARPGMVPDAEVSGCILQLLRIWSLGTHPKAIRQAGCSVGPGHAPSWPLPNVWLGTSVENQATADERILHLLATPAAKRFVSYEPALGPVSFRWLPAFPENAPRTAMKPGGTTDHLDGLRRLDWIIVGGESGPGARPFDIAWARSTVEQCKAAGVSCFVKQMGRVVHGSPAGFGVDRYILADGSEWEPPIIGFDRNRFERDNAAKIVGFKPFNSKGGDWCAWPEDLRVREFPR